MKPKVTAYSNGDDAVLFWETIAAIPTCLGFAIERKWLQCKAKPAKNGNVELLPNRTGFRDEDPQPNETRPSDEWPFQRYSWTDHGVNSGDIIQYRVIPVLKQSDGTLKRDDASASDWTANVSLSNDRGSHMSCYFNRGLVMSQFMAKYLKKTYGEITDENLQKFKADIKQHESKIRNFLMGELGHRLMELLTETKKNGGHVFAALYELSDDELIKKLKAFKGKAHVLLANGSAKKKGDDQNADARQQLNDAKVDVHDRMVAPKPLGHNKFLVLCDENETPKSVWTGSTNWAPTGLCTQINNGLWIDDASIAKVYQKQWEELRDAGDGYPAKLVDGNSKPRPKKVGGKPVDVWFTRTRNGEDRNALDEVINQAQEGILFLMFMPGKTGVDQTIRAKLADSPDLYVKGVISSQDKSTAEASIGLVENGERVDRLAIIQPEGIKEGFGQWLAEVTRSMFLPNPHNRGVGHAIVHSKMMVIDPFGSKPVVVTGSHNFSKPASESNDENFVIIRNHSSLAEAVAVHILSVYHHYRWRAYVGSHQNPWSGLVRTDNWQTRKMDPDTIRELKFWLPN